MARPSQGVTLENSVHVKSYFGEALSDYSRRDKLLIDPGVAHEALCALNEIHQVEYCDIGSYLHGCARAESNPNSAYMIELAVAGASVADTDGLDAWVLQYGVLSPIPLIL